MHQMDMRKKTSITLRVSDCTIEEVLHKIERESGFSFFINSKNLNLNRRVSVSASEKNIFQVLEQVFAGTNVEYKILDNKIVLTAKETKVTQQKNKTRCRYGKRQEWRTADWGLYYGERNH